MISKNGKLFLRRLNPQECEFFEVLTEVAISKVL